MSKTKKSSSYVLQSHQPSASLDDFTATHIGQKLQDTYTEIVEEPIPQKFLDLLAKIEKQENREE